MTSTPAKPMSAKNTPHRGEGRYRTSLGPSSALRDKPGVSRNNTPVRRGAEATVNAGANGGAVQEEMVDALEPPGHAQAVQPARARQDDAANIRGGEKGEVEEGLPPNDDPPPPLNNGYDRPQDYINKLRGLIFLLWAWIMFLKKQLGRPMTWLKQRQSMLFWSLLIIPLLVLVVLFVGWMKQPLHSDIDIDIDFGVSEPLSEQQLAEQHLQVQEWTQEMRKMGRLEDDWYAA